MKSNRVTITLSSGAEARLRVFGKSLSEVIDMLSYIPVRDYGRLFEAKLLHVNMVPNPAATRSAHVQHKHTDPDDDLDAAMGGVELFEGEPLAYWEKLYKDTSNKRGQHEVNDHAWEAITTLRQ